MTPPGSSAGLAGQNAASAGLGQGPSTPQLGAGSPSSGDTLARIREEVDLLRKVPGAVVQARAGQVDGLPDGTYAVEARVPRPSGGELSLLFDCPVQFPALGPAVEAALDEQPAAFNSVVVRQWGAHRYLVEIVNEARQFFG
jgi:hypothetical protein